MFFFVLEFLFYAFLILGGLAILLSILASEAFWNGVAAIVVMALLAGLVALAAWGIGSLDGRTIALGLAGVAGALIAGAVRVLITGKRTTTGRFVRTLTVLLLAATVAGGGAYLSWQDPALGVPAAAAFAGMALIIGVLDYARRANAHRPVSYEPPQQEYKYEKVP